MSLRNNYQQYILFAGPAPSSGFHFIDTAGNLNNNFGNAVNNANLLRNIDHLYSFSDSFSFARTDIKQLGNTSYVIRPNISPTPINVEFSYYLNDCKNLNSLGFLINSGQGIVSFVSGLNTKETSDYRDKRNLFLVLGNDGEDLLYRSNKPQFVDSKATGLKVFAYGDCYIGSYSTSAGVGAIPSATISYICENLVYYASGSGIDIPALNPKGRNEFSGVKCNIPPAYNSTSVVIPSNISVSISSDSRIENLGAIINDLSIQNYGISIPFNRSSCDSIGYRLPIDRPINFPIISSLSFNAIYSNFQSGNLNSLIRNDINYNISILLKSGICSTKDIMRYDFSGCKFRELQEGLDIGSNKTISLSFDCEIHPNSLTKGLFVSGVV